MTCAATNIPLLYTGAKVKFADIHPHSLNIDPTHVGKLVNERTAAIVCVHYGGLPCDMEELGSIASTWGIPVIEDGAHALGATCHGEPIGSLSDFTAFSFQAVKHITTGDGGMLTVKQSSLAEKAKRIRWLGVDRTSEHGDMGDNDIKEIGYKYQMTDIAASMGLAGLDELDQVLALRRKLFEKYKEELQGVPGIELIGGDYTDREHAAWLCTIVAEKQSDLQRKLSDVWKAKYLLVPQGLTEESEGNPCRDYLISLRRWFFYPVRLPCRAEPLEPTAAVKSFISKYYIEEERIDHWSVLRRSDKLIDEPSELSGDK